MNTPNKKPRPYRRITKATVAKHLANEIKAGNGTAAVRESNPEYSAPNIRAYRIKKKANEIATGDYIEEGLQQIGADAVRELGELVHSSDERIKTKNVHYVIDHIRGKALQRSESKHMNLNIQTVLE